MHRLRRTLYVLIALNLLCWLGGCAAFIALGLRLQTRFEEGGLRLQTRLEEGGLRLQTRLEEVGLRLQTRFDEVNSALGRTVVELQAVDSRAAAIGFAIGEMRND